MWKVAKEARLGNLETPPSVRKLQTALHAKAKAEPEYRFYLLYDKVYRADILSLAYARCKANDGAAGVDGQTFEDIEAYGKNDRTSVDREIADIEMDGRNRWLGELAQELRNKTYRPQAVRRVLIPKPNSQKKRPLGIATVPSNCTLARSAFGIGRDHPPLSSPSRSSVCCAEDQEGLRRRDVEPAPCRERLVCSPTRMD
jgi:hypothetical protein